MCVRPKGIRSRRIRFFKRAILQIMSDSWKAPKNIKKSRRSESDDEEKEHDKGGSQGELHPSRQEGPEGPRHDTRLNMPPMMQVHMYDPEFQRQQLQQQYQLQNQHFPQQHPQQPPFQHGPWTGMPPQIGYPYGPYNTQMFQPMYGQYFYPQPPMLPGHQLGLEQPSAAGTPMLSPPKTDERESDPSSKRPKLDDSPKSTSELTESQKAAIRDTKKVIQESMQRNISDISKSPTEQKPKTGTRSDRKEKKNAQSRARAAKLREKISEVKEKSEEEKTDEEIRLLQIFEERRRKKNERSRERAIEKKMEIERILAIPEAERTPEDASILEIAMKAKEKKNEGDRIRRERIKNTMIRKKPPGVRGRPRKYPPKDQKKKSENSTASQPESMVGAPPFPVASFAGPQGSMIPYGYASSAGPQSAQEGMQRPLMQSSELMQSQPPIAFGVAPHMHPASRLPQGSMTGAMFGESTSPGEQPNLSMYDMSHLLLYGGTNSEQEEDNEDEEKHASI